MDDLITIENVDDILEVMAKTPIVDNTCFFFIEQETMLPEIIKFINKDSATDTEVALAKFLIKKDERKYNAGLAIKMWLGWDDVVLSDDEIKEIINMRRAELSVERAKLNPIIKPFLLKKFGDKKVPKNKIKEALLGWKKKLLKKKSEQTISAIDNYLYINRISNALTTAENIVNQKIGEKSVDNKLSVYRGLKYERCVYSFITENIIKPGNISPNFIPLIASKSCFLGQMIPLLHSESGTRGVSQEKIEMFRELSNIVPDIKLNFIITGTSTDSTKIKTLHSMMSYFEDNPDVFEPVLFQIVYSLAVMEFFGIVHNDLHFENIMIQQLSSAVCMRFLIQGFVPIVIYTRYIVKFFDWDKGYVGRLGDNTGLYPYSNMHQVNKTRPKQDFAQFLCGLSAYDELWETVREKFFLGTPYSRDFYFFKPGGIKSVTVKDGTTKTHITDYFLREQPEKYEDKVNQIFWVEVNRDFFTDAPILLSTYSRLYPHKPIGFFKKLYIGVDKDIYDNTGNINVYFSTGWQCQSLFDISNATLKPAIAYIKDAEFLGKFKKQIACTSSKKEIRTYIFPTNEVPIIDRPCSYTLDNVQ